MGGWVRGEGVRVCTVCERVSLYMFREYKQERSG